MPIKNGGTFDKYEIEIDGWALINLILDVEIHVGDEMVSLGFNEYEKPHQNLNPAALHHEEPRVLLLLQLPHQLKEALEADYPSALMLHPADPYVSLIGDRWREAVCFKVSCGL